MRPLYLPEPFPLLEQERTAEQFQVLWAGKMERIQASELAPWPCFVHEFPVICSNLATFREVRATTAAYHQQHHSIGPLSPQELDDSEEDPALCQANRSYKVPAVPASLKDRNKRHY